MLPLFLFFITASGNTFQEHIFRKIIPKYTADSNVVSLLGLVNTHSPSDVSCAYECASTDLCFSFAYDATVTTCSLYSEKIPVVTSTSVSIYSDRCLASLSFRYERGLSFCYWISTDMETWQAANNTCHNKEATLAKTNTTEYLHFLFKFTRDTQVWVDGNDLAIEGTFVWSNGNRLPISDGIWDNGYWQPDGGRGVVEEDCCMIFDKEPMLHDEHCSRQHIFVCEYNLRKRNNTIENF